MVMLSELTAVCQTRRHLKVKVSGRALSQKHWIPILLSILQDSQSYYFFEIYLATIPFWNQMNNSCDMERFDFKILTSIWIIVINYNLASWITNTLRCTCYIQGDVRENCFRRFSVQYIWYTNHWFVYCFYSRIRNAGLRGLQGVVRKTVSDDLQVNIWEAIHMDKIVPSLLYNMHNPRLVLYLVQPWCN